MKSGINQSRDGLKKLAESLRDLTKREVLVGVPRTETARRDGEMTNASLAYIHDKGSPAANIPARPFMAPGMEDAKPKLVSVMKAGLQAAVKGNVKAANRALEAAGLIATSAIKRRITTGPFEPLADSTLRGRARRGRSGAAKELANRAAGMAPGTSLAKPLIDTGQMRNAITYVVRSK